MRLSRLSIFFGIWLIISASFMRQVLEFFWSVVGTTYAMLYTKIIFMILGLIAMYFMILRKDIKIPKLAAIAALTVFAYIYIRNLTIVAEKIHVIEYAVFGWLVCRDLTKGGYLSKGIVAACILCLLVGSIDEAFQAALPYRVFDWLDIRHNLFGGVEGVAICLLAK
jgi:hypothetical protein